MAKCDDKNVLLNRIYGFAYDKFFRKIIVFAGLYFDRDHYTILNYDEIQFALFLAVEIMELVLISREAMAVQFLCDKKGKCVGRFCTGRNR